MTEYLTLNPKDLSQPDLHAYLLSAVAPRPIAFASTIDKEGRINLSPYSFFNVFSSNPPIMIFSPANSGRENATKHSLLNVLETSEVTINIVNYPMAQQMSLASTAYDRGVNEFTKAGFTAIKSDIVQPPRVAESPVSFECIVNDVIALGDQGGAGNLVISEVVRIHIRSEYLNESHKLDTTKLDLIGRMGEMWYTRAIGESLFQIPKPLASKGIGVDALLESIRNSSILTGNELGQLGNMPHVPTDEEIQSALEIYNVDATMIGTERHHQLISLAIGRGDTLGALGLAFL